ncbi:NADH pyrophosphatase [bioreactor metagenome]|uniref:NAD(+) diphosphatase n=1 Tax=bioreactor metagenome TaxID=1076179 RepID=A0A645CNG8_9ZZZZ
MSFEPWYTVKRARPTPTDPILVLNRSQAALLPLGESGRLAVPCASCFPMLLAEELVVLGELHGRPCYGYLAAEFPAATAGLIYCDLREAFSRVDEAEYHLLLRGKPILEWLNIRRYCGVCGEILCDSEQEEARCCPNCGTLFFPKISPAVIVGVQRGKDEILLAHNHKFRSRIYSFIAGFVEPGESAEAAVRREVREEVGIEIDNIRYWGSQSWPFPDSLMLGFMADYVSGEVRPDGAEIADADFYRRNAMPDIPQPGSIARRMLDAWLDRD